MRSKTRPSKRSRPRSGRMQKKRTKSATRRISYHFRSGENPNTQLLAQRRRSGKQRESKREAIDEGKLREAEEEMKQKLTRKQGQSNASSSSEPFDDDAQQRNQTRDERMQRHENLQIMRMERNARIRDNVRQSTGAPLGTVSREEEELKRVTARISELEEQLRQLSTRPPPLEPPPLPPEPPEPPPEPPKQTPKQTPIANGDRGSHAPPPRKQPVMARPGGEGMARMLQELREKLKEREELRAAAEEKKVLREKLEQRRHGITGGDSD